ncbi:MAG TPA: hypothetical protein VH877_33950, partial [Polyangia bacterium]|nr:hypothetical protein [Polyangia bacterium]
EPDDRSPSLDEEQARSGAQSKLCDTLMTGDVHYEGSLCSDLDDRTTYTCSSRKIWRYRPPEGCISVPVH